MALPKHSGWTVERIVPLLGGSVVGTSLLLGRKHSPKWRGLTAFASANLVLYGIVGWCPMSLRCRSWVCRAGRPARCRDACGQRAGVVPSGAVSRCAGNDSVSVTRSPRGQRVPAGDAGGQRPTSPISP
ncbi:DUF2892 domain-containing protein [Rhodococcus hoagii]|nr:DUF2892 domain-containing protein [Prescottella equi]